MQHIFLFLCVKYASPFQPELTLQRGPLTSSSVEHKTSQPCKGQTFTHLSMVGDERTRGKSEIGTSMDDESSHCDTSMEKKNIESTTPDEPPQDPAESMIKATGANRTLTRQEEILLSLGLAEVETDEEKVS